MRQLVFHVLIGNNDAHAKNVGLIHDSDGTSISQIYDAVPNLIQRGRINWELAMAIDNVFDHRKITVERLVNEAQSWSVLRRDLIESPSTAPFTGSSKRNLRSPPPPASIPALSTGSRGMPPDSRPAPRSADRRNDKPRLTPLPLRSRGRPAGFGALATMAAEIEPRTRTIPSI
ncbi:HipA domain-containing protein [Cryobacterium sp. TMS1-20-1]|nr:HipA domain-containing protein [Cryobacterium sp. TMS1-20-1]